MHNLTVSSIHDKQFSERRRVYYSESEGVREESQDPPRAPLPPDKGVEG